ncbi:MAG: hypothetical protein ACUVRD_06685 [Bacteroidia bacterium]
MGLEVIKASYRDPAGYVYVEGGRFYRYVQPTYLEENSGLVPFLKRCIQEGLVLSFEPTQTPHIWELEPLVYQLHPWEWPFSFWQQGAILTLELARKALKEGFLLKDATAFNVQLHKGKVVWIDHLSFIRYTEGQDWMAYLQFVEHWLVPMALMHYGQRDLALLFQVYINGIPVEMASKLLPWRSRFHVGTAVHIHTLAKRKLGPRRRGGMVSLRRLYTLLDSLELCVKDYAKPQYASIWEDYEHDCHYDASSRQLKRETVLRWVQAFSQGPWIDIGSNTGEYTQLLLEHTKGEVLAWEGDAKALDTLWSRLGCERLYPIWANVLAPSPSVGWRIQERPDLLSRMGKIRGILALALIHHLRLGGFVPFESQVAFFASLLDSEGIWIVEYVPPTDPMVKRLHTMPQMFPDYQESVWENTLQTLFHIKEKAPLPNQRILYLCQKK